MLKLTEELDSLKKELETSADGGDKKANRINELTLEIQELTDQYEQNKRDLYEQLDEKDKSLSEVYLQVAD